MKKAVSALAVIVFSVSCVSPILRDECRATAAKLGLTEGEVAQVMKQASMSYRLFAFGVGATNDGAIIVRLSHNRNGPRVGWFEATYRRSASGWTEDVVARRELISRAQKPNKAPEPTALLVTPHAGACVAPSRVVAHL